MALVTITLLRDPDGEFEILVGLRSGCDAMPHEHESLHRRVAATLLPGVVAERVRPGREAAVG